MDARRSIGSGAAFSRHCPKGSAHHRWPSRLVRADGEIISGKFEVLLQRYFRRHGLLIFADKKFLYLHTPLPGPPLSLINSSSRMSCIGYIGGRIEVTLPAHSRRQFPSHWMRLHRCATRFGRRIAHYHRGTRVRSLRYCLGCLLAVTTAGQRFLLTRIINWQPADRSEADAKIIYLMAILIARPDTLSRDAIARVHAMAARYKSR